MKYPWLYKGLLYLLMQMFAATATVANETETSTELFKQLIEESGLAFSPAPDFTDIKIRPNPVIHYERALQHKSGSLELRLIIRPLARISIDYNDPHNAAPEPNHLFPLLFESMITELSSSGNTPNSEYPQAQAQELFNAGWAAAAVFDVNPKFSDTYRQALLIGIHKDRQADAYTLFLFNEYAQAKPYIQSALSTLSFSR